MVIVSVLATGLTFAESADNILDSVKKNNNFRWAYMKVKMVLEDSMGTKRERVFEWYMENENVEHKGVVVVTSPTSMNGIKFLFIKKGEEHLQYIYMPLMKRVRRIGMDESYSSFLGSDLTYYDLKHQNYSGYRNILMGREACPQTGGSCYKIKTMLNSNAPYKYIVQWIKVDAAIPVKISFFDTSGLVKVLEVKKIKNVKGHIIASSTHIHNVVTKHTTNITVEDVSIDTPLDERVFSFNALK